MDTLTQTTASLPRYSLHDAAFVLYGLEPKEEAPHAVRAILRELMMAAKAKRLTVERDIVRLPDSSFFLSLEVDHLGQRPALQTTYTQRTYVVREELLRWAADAGIHSRLTPKAPRELGTKERENMQGLIYMLAHIANFPVSEPYKAGASIEAACVDAFGSSPLKGKTIGDKLTEASEIVQPKRPSHSN